MKKKYQKPTLDVIELEAEQIICDSDLNYGGDGNGKPVQAPALDFDHIIDNAFE